MVCEFEVRLRTRLEHLASFEFSALADVALGGLCPRRSPLELAAAGARSYLGRTGVGHGPKMILIGQYDSPFVRRTAIALRLYGFAYEHRPWSVWADADRLAALNPLRRVPTLVLDDGEVLIESGSILDALDQLAGPSRALAPVGGPSRRRALYISALATGLADKAVSLFYEGLLHETPSQTWIDRCRAQIADVLDALERERAASASVYWLGESIGHADIAVVCALRFVSEAHAGLFDAARWPRLAAHADACEALAVFREICQPLSVALREDA